ncbi:hypothetical protein LCGC14_2842590 [marine sediment metagenome]|uniref:Uncharacterized protein n=1 Tax=marine sediment metagenome TaxID=412755 RepID=A0A0F9B1X4_9ZZZZ
MMQERSIGEELLFQAALIVLAAGVGAATGGVAAPAALSAVTRILAQSGVPLRVLGRAARTGAAVGAPLGILEQLGVPTGLIPFVPRRPRTQKQAERDKALRDISAAGLQPRVKGGKHKGQLRKLSADDKKRILASTKLTKRTKDIALGRKV